MSDDGEDQVGPDTPSRGIDSPIADDLRQHIADRQVAAIVGAGVTVASSGDAEAASWKGLLQLGIDRCVGLQLVTPDWGERRRSELLSGDLDELLSVAELVATRLGYPDGGEYRRWLRETVGELRVQRPDVLEALKALDVPLVTTNYDGLLEEV